jgi:hypothetical protein
LAPDSEFRRPYQGHNPFHPLPVSPITRFTHYPFHPLVIGLDCHIAAPPAAVILDGKIDCVVGFQSLRHTSSPPVTDRRATLLTAS